LSVAQRDATPEDAQQAEVERLGMRQVTPTTSSTNMQLKL